MFCSLERDFTIELGPSIILARNNYGDTRAALYIQKASTTPEFSYETTTVNAKARRSYNATFYVRGMGFPIASTTRLKVYRTTWSREAYVNCVMDRDNKIVRLISPVWSMSGTTNNYVYSIEVQGSGATYQQSNRW